jgi:uncharacterized protein (TIGR00730 family)
MSPPRRPFVPPIAYENPEFLRSMEARPLRIMAEFLDPLVRLRKENVADTIVIFGSARIGPRARAQRKLEAAQRRLRSKPTPAARDALRAARAGVQMSRFYEEARELSRRITRWALGFGENPRRFVICSGGGPGIMEAANRGAIEAGGKSMGLGIRLPHELAPNRYISRELNFYFHYFFMRKLWFAQLAKALVVFPGGYGTMDELLEMLTLAQTGKVHPHNLILIYGRRYWDEVIDWRAMLRWGTINPREYALLQFADNVDEAFERVRTAMEKHHREPSGELL